MGGAWWRSAAVDVASTRGAFCGGEVRVNTTMEAGGVCGRIAQRLLGTIGPSSFKEYFNGSARLSMAEHELLVGVPSPFVANLLSDHFGRELETLAREETGDPRLAVRWVVNSASDASARATHTTMTNGAMGAAAAPLAPRPPAEAERASMLPRRPKSAPALMHRLDHFIIGASNRLAADAVDRLADPSSDPGFRALFIHGECGVGKTHLLQGLAARFLSRRPGARVRYATAEAYMHQYVGALRRGKIESFQSAIRSLDLLCIDDVSFLAGREGTQAEFQRTFDALEGSGGRIAVVSDAHPRLVKDLSARLVSRLMAGMVVRIDRPDRSMRAQLTAELARRQGLALEPRAAEWLADACADSARELEGAIMKISASARLMGSGMGGMISVAAAAAALRTDDTAAPRKPVRADHIVRVVSSELGVQVQEVMGPSRHRRVVLARSIAAYLARRLTSLSFPEIARALGKSNHSTIVTAYQRIKRAVENARDVPREVLDEPIAMDRLCDRLRLAVLR